MKIAAAYIRVSTEDQAEYSPDSQLKLIRDYVKRNDMVLPDEFIYLDEGISGRKAKKRPAFMRMIGTAKTKPKPFDCILLWKFSRFARNREDSIVYKSMLRKQCGIDVISISEQLSEDKTSILIEALLEAMDEYYSINLAEEVKRGMLEAVSRGNPVTIPSYGYDIKDKRYIINSEEAPIVRMVFTDFNSGAGLRDLAQKLNTMGIRTKRGSLWENRTVEYILRNPVYIGKIRWTPTGRVRRDYDNPDTMIIDSDHDPIIDNTVWEETQGIIAERKRMFGKYARKNAIAQSMLQGLVRCSNCGATLVRSAVGKESALQCHNYSCGKCDVSHHISLRRIEAMVISMIDADLKNSSFELIHKAPAAQQRIEADVISQQIQREKQKLIRVREAYENGIDNLEEYRANKQKITDRIKQLEEEQPKQPVAKKDDIKAFKQAHRDVVKQLQNDDLSANEKNMILRSFVDHIVFDRKNTRIQVFYYD